jgi:hypothetical protein
MKDGAVNPYAVPTARVDDVAQDSEAEAIRRAHINHEASIKSVGILYYLGGVLVVVGGLTAVVGGLSGASGNVAGIIGGMVLITGIGAIALLAGWGVRALRPWGRNVGTVLSLIGLANFPTGTLINLYILYLFYSKKGRTIFGPGYRDVVAATPHVKYKTSIVVWIFLGLIVLLLAAGILMPMFATK